MGCECFIGRGQRATYTLQFLAACHCPETASISFVTFFGISFTNHMRTHQPSSLLGAFTALLPGNASASASPHNPHAPHVLWPLPCPILWSLTPALTMWPLPLSPYPYPRCVASPHLLCGLYPPIPVAPPPLCSPSPTSHLVAPSLPALPCVPLPIPCGPSPPCSCPVALSLPSYDSCPKWPFWF